MITCKDCYFFECCSTLNPEFKKCPRDYVETNLCAKQCTKFKDKKAIYVITKGSYSDYHICTATTDKKRAEKLKELFYNDGSMYPDDVYIEEFVDGTYDDMLDRGFEAFEIWFDSEYKINRISPQSRLTMEYTDDDEWNVVIKSSNERAVLPYRVYVQARDEEHARKIAQDIMAEYKYRKEIDEKPV